MDNNQYNSFIKSAEKFIEVFDKYKNKNIVLYGLGQYTATLINLAKEYHFIGLLDGDENNISKRVYGLKVLSLEEAKEKADLIVINTSTFYWNIIYERVKDIGVPVYFANGELAKKIDNRSKILSEDEKNLTIEEVEGYIDKADVVSFDLYDTLIMRTVCNPNDVFKIMEIKLEEHFGKKIHYQEMRNKSIANINKENYTLDDIYTKMKELYPCIDVDFLRQLELKVEKEVTTVRHDVKELFRYSLEHNKEVYILTDMYLPMEFVINLLNNFEIEIPAEHLWISGDKKINKYSGTMWRTYNNIVKNRNTIHIGDSLKADIYSAKKYGIKTVKIPSAAKMMEELLTTDVWSQITSVYSSITMGIVINILFNSPFAWNERNNKYYIETCKKFGKVVFGNIVLTFLLWLLYESKKRKIDNLIFLSRDGYFLEKDYLYLIHKLHNISVPEEDYLYISRNAVLALMAVNDSAAFNTFQSFSFKGKFKDYLKIRFNLEVQDDEIYSENECILPEDIDLVTDWIKPYYEKILDKLKVHSDKYYEYLKKFNMSNKCAVVDICYKGTIQYWLSKAIKQNIKGFYFVADVSEKNDFYKKDNMIPCFQKDKTAENSCVWKNHKIVESFFTAPYGMMRCMDENGEIVSFEAGENQLNFMQRELMNDGIKEFIGDYLLLLDKLEMSPYCIKIDAITIDQIFGTWFDGRKDYSECVKKCFWHEDSFINGNQEYNLFN